MKVYSTRLSRDFEELIIIPISDVHGADRFADEEMLDEKIKFIENTENAFTILNGDIVNMGIKSSVSDVYKEKYSPNEQLNIFVDKFYPIKDKILGVTEGNHERRVSKEVGIDLTERFCRELGITDRYGAGGIYLIIRVGEQAEGRRRREGGKGSNYRQICYTFYVTHGSRGGRKAGGKVNALVDLSLVVDADIYIHGHTHLGAIVPGVLKSPDLRNNVVITKDILYVSTSGMLDYGGYAQEGCYPPLSKKSPVIYLGGRKRKIDADLGTRLDWNV